MTVWSRDGKTMHSDVRDQRIAAGTLGGEHAVPSSFGGISMRSVVTPFDPAIAYRGGWNIDAGDHFEEYLAQYAESTTNAGNSTDSVSLTFTGTSVAILGALVANGGRATVSVDGVLQGGKTDTFSYLQVAQYSLGGLNNSDTTIAVHSTNGFPGSGYIIIDDEIITYTSTDSTNFYGCTRGASGTTPAHHNTATMVYAYGSVIDFYSAYKAARVPVWRNDQLSPGTHTITVQSLGTKSVNSTGYVIHLNGFVVNGQIGASNISTNLDVVTGSGITFNGSGVSTLPATLAPATVDRQIIGVLACGAYKSDGTYLPCFASFDSSLGNFYFYCPTGAGLTLTVSLSVIVVGTSI